MLKKDWYSVILPKSFGEEEIAEVMAADEKTLIGRKVEVGMNEIGKDMSKFYIKAAFRIVGVEKGKVLTEYDNHRCMREYISHIVRSRVTRVDNNIVVTTKDGRKLRVKGLLLFSRNVNRPMKGKAIAIMNETFLEMAAKYDFDNFVKAMISGEVTNETRKRCIKIYPVSKCEIRKSEVILRERKHI
jgi:small subunit ribosomal protein S3Ae